MSRKLTRILTKSRFSVLNFGLIQSVGLDAACLFGVLIYKCPENDEEFDLDTEKIDAMLGMGHSSRRKAEERLIAAGLISKQAKGAPPRNYYKINKRAADDLLDGMIPRPPKTRYEPSRLDDQGDQSGSKQIAATPTIPITSKETEPRKNKRKNNTKKNTSPTPPSGESDERQRYHGKRSRAKKEKIAHTQPPVVDVASPAGSAGEPDPPVPMGVGATESGVGAAIAGGPDSIAAGGRSPVSVDPTLKKDGTPRADAPEMKFLLFYMGKYEEILGTKPIIGPYGRTTKVIRTILEKMEGRKPELARIVERFLGNQDPFYITTGWSLMTLAMDNTLNAHSDTVWAARAAKQKKQSQSPSRATGRRLDDPVQEQPH